MSRETKNEISKERILKAAIEEFGQNDYSSASTNTICKNHGISKGLLFHYYKNKEELFLVCVDQCFKELGNYLQAHYVKTGEGIEQNLNHYIEVRFEFFRTFPHYEQIFKTATFNAPGSLQQEIKRLKTFLRQVNQTILLDMISTLELKEEVDKDEVIQVILGFSDYLIIRQREDVNRVMNRQTEEIFEEQNKALINMIKMVLYGIVK